MTSSLFGLKDIKTKQGLVASMIAIVALAIVMFFAIPQLEKYLSTKFYEHGKILQEKGELSKAKIYYKVAPVFNPKSDFSADVHFILAGIYADEEDYEKVITELRHVIRADPSFTDVYIPLGQALKESQRLDEAIEILEKSLNYKLSPELSLIAHELLGELYFLKKDFDTAIHYYKKVKKMEPENISHYLALSSSYMKVGAHGDAINTILEAIKFEPKNVNLLLQMSSIYITMEQYDKAIVTLNEILSLDTLQGKVYYNLALCFSHNEQYEDAIRAYEKAIDLAPDFLPSYAQLAIIYNMQESYEKAIEIAEKAIERDKDFAPAYYEIGRSYGLLGQEEIATDYFKRAFNLDSELRKKYPEAYRKFVGKK